MKTFSLYLAILQILLSKNVSSDKLFMGIDGIDLKVGLTTPNLMKQGHVIKWWK